MNSRPPDPQSGALSKLRYVPKRGWHGLAAPRSKLVIGLQQGQDRVDLAARLLEARRRIRLPGAGRFGAEAPARAGDRVSLLVQQVADSQADSHVVWKTTRGSPFVPSPLVYGDYLYLVNDMSSIITCLNAKTGETIWQERLGRPRREGVSASPIVVDDKLFVTNDDGQTFVLRTGPEFELLHINDIGARTLASPALVDGTWYIRTADELIAIAN